MGVLNEFDSKSHAILLDGEFRRSEATEARSRLRRPSYIVIPATDALP